ncbi:MAG: T9SS type A sorting domain-containing protein [Ignavibacteriae bacterium]|nr:T9SS type A sorting domain-containing protein [Ignavibacteriota bacterium]MCB9205978.1 T9SS type A sorting domain-containing protein [Ignavibacteriales bacterium]MCB9209255.1 T9SS type A sorting domain-containing protein [Ignavibacteriales bacterium]MCB9257897.1 T9SS type A sorting domain-containing protein [Ignavibacteriales bacterium]
MKVLELTDPDGDMIYDATLTVKAPSWNGFIYRYAFVQGGTMTQEASGFGDFAYRVRYIEQAGYRKFVQPYAAPTDSWLGDQEDKSSQSETGPAGDITGVQNLGLVANKFSLEQNYPNPFNPTTQIRFSIPATNVVTLKIYNILGQEVKTLINKEMTAGSYEFNFNASNLASGLYVYQLSSGDFVSNKKMMLLK